LIQLEKKSIKFDSTGIKFNTNRDPVANTPEFLTTLFFLNSHDIHCIFMQTIHWWASIPKMLSFFPALYGHIISIISIPQNQNDIKPRNNCFVKIEHHYCNI